MGKQWGKWTYFYFGYSFRLKQAYAYIRFFDQSQNSFLFEEVYHFVPNYLSVFFAEDGSVKLFDVIIQYILRVKHSIGIWVLEMEPSQLLRNQAFGQWIQHLLLIEYSRHCWPIKDSILVESLREPHSYNWKALLTWSSCKRKKNND